MNEATSMSLSTDLTRWLTDHPLLRLGILFGSTNDGEASFESDLDLAVMGERPLSADETKTAIEALAQVSGRPVDLVDLQTTRGPLLRQILCTGHRLYCADEVLYATLVKRHMYNQTDWAPYRRRILEERRRRRWISNS